MAMRQSRLHPEQNQDSGEAEVARATQPVRTAESDDSDPRIAKPHEAIAQAVKFKSSDGKKVFNPTHVRTVDWYERHGFKKA